MTIVGTIHSHKPKQCRLLFPMPWGHLFNPGAGDGKVTIGVTCLPGIAR